jgi:hypothetical protein
MTTGSRSASFAEHACFKVDSQSVTFSFYRRTTDGSRESKQNGDKQLKTSALARTQKSEAVMRVKREAQERRQRIASDFKARLLLELGPGELPASRASLVEAAVSAHVQMVELSSQFLRINATPRAVQQLTICRGQLQRALRALGLVARADDPEPPPVGDLLAPYRAARKESDAAEPDAVPAQQ